MYYLNPNAGTLSLNAIDHFAGLVHLALDQGERALTVVRSAQEDCLSNLSRHSQENAPNLSHALGESLKDHAIRFSQDWLDTWISAQEQLIQSFESQAHGINEYLAYSIDKASRATPQEILPAVQLIQETVSSLDHTVTSLSDTAAKVTEGLEESLDTPASRSRRPSRSH